MSDYFLDTSIKKIKEASENNKLVIFVGAGVSANSGTPTWNELIREFAKDLGEFNVDNSPDLYLKIPQYYFNERGEKEYFEKLNEVFLKKKYKSNPIHKEIFKLKPTHIITTNYDTLLEEAAIEEGQFFHTVKHDLDLPYDTFNKNIIKMHGDFENRNIVLKEDDYLNYSSNFTLIESYIKSLIATNTVLFIGYSINDTNFNLIFQWVKNILNNHFQPAYLIESSKSYSRMEQSYYKNRGINILYYNEISNLQNNHMFDEDNWRGNNLFNMLNYFNSFDKSRNMNDLEIIYGKLACLEKLKFIMPDQIVKSLDLKSVGYDLFGDRTLSILTEENSLSRVFSKVDQFKDDLIFKKIINIFRKANIHGISKDNEIVFNIDKENNYLENLMNKIIETDSLLDPIDISNLTSLIDGEDYFLMLKQAAAFCDCEKYLDSYKYYKTISLKAFKDKEYLIYYISEFNRKQTGYFLINSYQTVDEDTKIEIQELDLENIYTNLPYEERKSLAFLKEIQDFHLIYKVQNQLNKEVNTLKGTKRTVESGGFSSNPSLNKNFHITFNVWMFIEANYLCINNYIEIKNLYSSFIEGIFASYSIKVSNSNGLFGEFVNKIEKLDLYEVYIIVTKLKTDTLENILNDYSIKEINLTDEAFKYILQILNKFIKNILANNNQEKSKRYLHNLLTLISKTKLSFEQTNDIAKKLILLINENTYVNEFKYINNFIVAMANQEILSQENISEYLNKYLEAYLKNKEIFTWDKSLYKNLTNIYKNYKEYPIKENISSNIIELTKKYYEEKNYNYLYDILTNIVIPIQKNLKNEYRSLVKNILKNLLLEIKNKEDSLKNTELYFYFLISINGIVNPDKHMNKRFIEATINEINNQNSSIKTYPDPIEQKLTMLTSLYRRKIIKKEEIENYMEFFDGYSEYFELIFNRKNLKLTDLDLIQHLTKKEIRNIMKNEQTKERIYSLLEKKMIDSSFGRYKDILERVYEKKY